MTRHSLTLAHSILLAIATLPSVLSLVVLEERYDHSGALSHTPSLVAELSDDSGSTGWTRRDKILFAHALAGFCAWQVFAPLAVLIAACGRSWGVWWFRLHWMIQVFLTVPLTVTAVVLGSVAAQLEMDQKAFDRHKAMGFAILFATWLQMGIGYWATLKQKLKAAEAVQTEENVPPKPRSRNSFHFLHIILGTCLLSAGTIQVSWGFAEYESEHGSSGIPEWARAIHWLLLALPIAFIIPFFIIRGLVRIRKGHTFSEAFLKGNPPPISRSPPPRKLWLGKGDRLSGSGVPPTPKDEEETGTTYERGTGRGGARKLSNASNWPGAATREEYEDSLKASTVLHYDYDDDDDASKDTHDKEDDAGVETSLLPKATDPTFLQRLSGRTSMGSERSDNYTPSEPVEDVPPTLAFKRARKISDNLEMRQKVDTPTPSTPPVPPRPVPLIQPPVVPVRPSAVPIIKPPVPRQPLSTVAETDPSLYSQSQTTSASSLSITHLYGQLPRGSEPDLMPSENPWQSGINDVPPVPSLPLLPKERSEGGSLVRGSTGTFGEVRSEIGSENTPMATRRNSADSSMADVEDPSETGLDRSRQNSGGTGKWFANRGVTSEE